MAYAFIAVLGLFLAGMIIVDVQDRRRRDRAFARALAAHAEERRQLLDRIMHLSGKTWALPPVEETVPDLPEDPYWYAEQMIGDEA